MSYAAEFRAELNDLLDRRTEWLETLFDVRRPGPPRRFTKDGLERAIARLQGLASEAFADRLAREWFEARVSGKRSWHPKRGKGWGRPAKKATFKEWFREKVGPGPTIYVFWNRSSCLYVGKTTGNGSRIAGHFDKHWFGKTTRIDVYAVKGRRGLPALECLAEHRFLPTYNRIAPETKKWTTKCPLCEIHKQIDRELREMFWPRRRSR